MVCLYLTTMVVLKFFFVYYHVGDLYLIIFFQPIFTLRVRRSNSQNAYFHCQGFQNY